MAVKAGRTVTIDFTLPQAADLDRQEVAATARPDRVREMGLKQLMPAAAQDASRA